MKKTMLFCILALCVCSCKIIKYNPSIVKQIDFVLKGKRMAKKMELNYYYGKKSPFVFDNNAIFIPCKINDTTHLVFYENKSSGIGTTRGLLTEKILGNAELPKCIKTIKIRKERKTKNNSNYHIIIKSGLRYYDVESDFFHFKNLVGVVTSQSNDTVISECTFEKSPSRFIINNILLNWNDIMLLSFSDTTIMLLDSVGTYDTAGFTLVKSMYTCISHTVHLTIDSIEYSFIFDTGHKGFLTLPQRNEIDTLITQQTNTITMGDLDSILGEIHYVKNLTHPIMGMQFISQFDWVIDIYKQKIYAKRVKIYQSDIDKK